MALALYRKYRPATFAELADQQHVKTTLLAELEQGKVGQAYLFTGPRGVGKTTTARLLAKAANCERRKGGEPCNTCASCKRFIESKNLDLLEIDAASNTGVDHVREHIIESSRFQPTQSRVKVYVIDEVHMLSASAFNALLKTLEEPPSHVLFILATTEVQKVPETIISRCQRFDFRKIPIPDLVARLRWIAEREDVRVATDVLEDIARRSDGSSRDAEVYLGQLISLGERDITTEVASLVLPRSDRQAIETFLLRLATRDRVGGVEFVTSYLESGGNLPQFADDTVEFLRDLLLAKLGAPPVTFTKSEAIERLLAAVSVDEFRVMIERLLEARDEIRRSDLPQLALELAVLDLVPQDVAAVAANVPTLPAAKRTLKEQRDAPAPPPRPAGPSPATPKKAKPAASALTVAKIAARWPEVILALRKHNHSLALTLKVSTPTSFEAGELTLAFAFPFYLERISEVKNRWVVEDVLEEVFGEPIRIVGTVSADPATKPAAGESLWDQVSEAFGETP